MPSTAKPSNVVELRDVSRVFPGPPPVRALHNIELDVATGDYLAITGPSGSGKSTLLNLLGLLDRPSSGDYFLDGSPTIELSEAELTTIRGRKIGFVFQEFHLLQHRTALENVALGLLYTGIGLAERKDQAVTALHQVGLAHRLQALPSTLSGGERQRVAIARALIGNPALLLCDEPTGNLDSENAKVVLDLFEQLNSDGVTLLVITHDHNVASRSPRRVTLHDGYLLETSRGHVG